MLLPTFKPLNVASLGFFTDLPPIKMAIPYLYFITVEKAVMDVDLFLLSSPSTIFPQDNLKKIVA